MHRYSPGARLVRREVLHGRVWLENPVTVVSDDGDVLAIRLDPGSAFTFHDHPLGPHPWSAFTQWSGPTVLQLMRTATAYAVWKFYEADGSFRYWYINFEAPIVRGADGFDTGDHGLDLIVHPDGRRQWKDVEDLHWQRLQGRIDLDTVTHVLSAAAEVTDLLDRDTQWWKPWGAWTPHNG